MRPWLLLLLVCASAHATEPEFCPPDTEGVLSNTRLLRATSLDVRGVLPSQDDYAAVTDQGADDAVLDAWLDSPEFTDQVVRHHRALFWNSLGGVDLLDNDVRLRSVGDVWYRNRNVAETYRGLDSAHCGDFEATFDGDGKPIATYNPTLGHDEEGWVWVAPYWDLQNPIKVCAFDAQTAASSSLGVGCDTNAGEDQAECGCGPELAWCYVSDVHSTLRESFVTDLDMRVAHMMDSDASYLDLFTDDVAFINGPIAHFYLNQVHNRGDINFVPLPLDEVRIPDVDWEDQTFYAVSQGEQHAGLLTSVSYLLRFQTNRSRANQFYNQFLCQPFQPPDTGIEGLDDPVPSLDLTQRQGCDYCHALLEPAAAHWGRWPESGGGYLQPDDYPAFSPECSDCAVNGGGCPDWCDEYLTDLLSTEQSDFLGWLLAYEFLEDRHESNVEEGPKLLVNTTAADGRLPTCVATRTAEWLLGRTMTPEDEEWIDSLSDEFITSEYRYRELVKAIVRSDNYRRAR